MLTVSGGQGIAFRTDFNAVDDGNRLRALGRYASPGWQNLEVKQWVRAFDGEGNQCLALIERIDGDLFFLRADWDSWRSEEPLLQITADAPHSKELALTSSLR